MRSNDRGTPHVSGYRTDLARNMARFYRLGIGRDLFGAWCIIREWGRIGRAEALAALVKTRAAKERRGYF